MYEYNARVLRIVDGDTIDVELDLGFSVSIKQRLRLARIDAYETRLGKNTTEKEKAKGLEAKAFVQELLPFGTTVRVSTQKDSTGKYGRYIAEIFYDGTKNLNDELVQRGYAIFYEA